MERARRGTRHGIRLLPEERKPLPVWRTRKSFVEKEACGPDLKCKWKMKNVNELQRPVNLK